MILQKQKNERSGHKLNGHQTDIQNLLYVLYVSSELSIKCISTRCSSDTTTHLIKVIMQAKESTIKEYYMNVENKTKDMQTYAIYWEIRWFLKVVLN